MNLIAEPHIVLICDPFSHCARVCLADNKIEVESIINMRARVDEKDQKEIYMPKNMAVAIFNKKQPGHCDSTKKKALVG